MVSCYRGNIDVVEYLISQNIDVDTQANCGSTALHLACEQGKVDIVKVLVYAGKPLFLLRKNLKWLLGCVILHRSMR